MHQVNDIALNINTVSQDFSTALYSKSDHFWSVTLFDVINDVLDELDIQNEEIVINELSIDVGEIASDRFNIDFPQLVHEKLTEELIKLLHKGESPNIQRTQIAYRYFLAYQRYLLSGLWSKELVDSTMHSSEILHLVLSQYFSELKKTLLSSENKHVIARFAAELNQELLSLFIMKLFPLIKVNSLSLKLSYQEHKAKLISSLLANEEHLKSSTQNLSLEDMIQSSVNQIASASDIDNVMLHRDMNIASYKDIFEIIDNKQEIYKFRNQIFKCLSNSGQLELLIDHIQPYQNEKLIIGLYAVEANYILPFFREITLEVSNSLVGVSKLNNIKSIVIYTILIEYSQKVINKRYFFQQLINRLGAHFDVANHIISQLMIKELSKIKYIIPYDLIGILTEINDAQYSNQTASNENNKISLEESTPRVSNSKQTVILKELDKALTTILGYAVHWEFDEVLGNVALKNASYLQRYKKELQVIFHYLYKKHQHQFQSKELMTLLKILLQKNQTFVHSIQAVINYLEKQLPNQIFQSWMQYIETNEQKHPILETINEQQINTKDEAVETITTAERTHYQVNHAGIVLLAPYLPMLFAKLDLTESGQFKDQTAQIKAVAVLAYIVNTQLDERTCNEPIHKILVGLPMGIHITSIPELTDIDIAIMNSLLDNAAQQWAVIKTRDALREAFLEREGQLYITEDFYQLTPEPKSYDMLLDSIPWSYKTTKFSWMEKAIITNWR